ncbi:MAG: 23S rRNA (guanosine(2251)-2'-O)-methyltransferase RlmB [Archaeoglobaceae archaeon]|nr:23S rRNA (guanosine(2251)-2'-O)-methyltransferase RlmB [Archaeoglobaceae archaeon]MCX8151575.1 23S rRNA (guanosine(2251)-2'-O)-methyltransferase RlmB [Archaeoglobaceae archaeon]MDW8013147.1 23S rRNA (guanosine(2251)-2'-O)-methyltransferase RlmB [Archaeoglobaceae archaeon]
MKVYGYNAVSEALKAEKVSKIYVSSEISEKIKKILEKAKKKRIPIYKVEDFREKIAAEVSPVSFVDLDHLIQRALNQNNFILILDNVTDQRNLGACLRSAEFFGAAGVLIPKRRVASIEEGAIKTSAGAVFHIPIAREENLASAIKKMKKMGFFVLALDLDGKSDLSEVDVSPPIALVIGGEDKGISLPVKSQCDEVVKIKGFGKVDSLNLAVVAGIAMYEVVKKMVMRKHI